MNPDLLPADPPAGSARVQRWSAPACPFSIDYSPELLNRLRLRSVEAFHALPHGGLEIGGLLFGRVSPNARTPLRIEIAAERPIECSHAAGPSFILSEDEQVAVTASAERARLDPEIAGLSVLGFWVSHSRTGLDLTPDDQELFKRAFPHSWQIALVLKPVNAAPTRAGFFFRSGDRTPTRDSRRDFYADPNLTAVSPTPEPEATGERYQPIVGGRREQLLSSLPPDEFPETQTARAPRSVSIPVAVALMLASSIATAGAAYLLRNSSAPSAAAHSPDSDLNLEIFEGGPARIIHWNAKAAEVQNAVRAELVVRDAGHEQSIPLTTAALKLGYLRFLSASTGLSVTMRVYGQDGQVEQANTRFTGN